MDTLFQIELIVYLDKSQFGWIINHKEFIAIEVMLSEKTNTIYQVFVN